jgi:hypothetical protein
MYSCCWCVLVLQLGPLENHRQKDRAPKVLDLVQVPELVQPGQVLVQCLLSRAPRRRVGRRTSLPIPQQALHLRLHQGHHGKGPVHRQRAQAMPRRVAGRRLEKRLGKGKTNGKRRRRPRSGEKMPKKCGRCREKKKRKSGRRAKEN